MRSQIIEKNSYYSPYFRAVTRLVKRGLSQPLLEKVGVPQYKFNKILRKAGVKQTL